MTNDRGSWGSRPGFILAATGSAVGLGNIWGFPTQVGQGGGAAFVLIYLVAVVFICAPILLGEVLVGRYAQLGPAGAVRRISPTGPWWVIGLLAVAAGTFILSFYAVIAGWTVQYLWLAVTNGLASDAEGSGALFGQLAADSSRNILFTGLFLVATAWCVNRGIRRGIEAASRLMMPLLFVLLVILAIRAVTLPGAAEGLAYYLRPDLSQALNPEIIGAAVGQAFFSLSLGMGALITYGSYLHRSHAVRSASVAIVGIDTTIALLAGFIIFPAGFSIASFSPGATFDPTAGGPGLIFAVLPQLFATLPGGLLFGAAFFLLLSVAAFTSTISLLEVPVAHAIDQWRWPRRKAVLAVGAFTFAFSIPSVLSFGGGFFSALPAVGGTFFDLMVNVWNEGALPVGGMLISLFIGWKWGARFAGDELRRDGPGFPGPGLWGFLIRFVSPAAIFLLIVFRFVG